MKIINLGKSEVNYYGYYEDDDNYVDFVYPFEGPLYTDWFYPKIDYGGHLHFAQVVSKYIPKTEFLEEPIEIAEITLAELDRVYALITGKKTAEAKDPS